MAVQPVDRCPVWIEITAWDERVLKRENHGVVWIERILIEKNCGINENK